MQSKPSYIHLLKISCARGCSEHPNESRGMAEVKTPSLDVSSCVFCYH